WVQQIGGGPRHDSNGAARVESPQPALLPSHRGMLRGIAGSVWAAPDRIRGTRQPPPPRGRSGQQPSAFQGNAGLGSARRLAAGKAKAARLDFGNASVARDDRTIWNLAGRTATLGR